MYQSNMDGTIIGTTAISCGVAPTAALVRSDVIPTWTDLSETARRDLRRALACVIKICELHDERLAHQASDARGERRQMPVVLDCRYLSQRIFSQPPKGFDLDGPTFANVLSLLRYVLRRIGRHLPAEPQPRTLLPVWQVLHEHLNEHERLTLIAFMRFCCRGEIVPIAATSDTLAAFEVELGDMTLCKDPGSQSRRVAAAWNKARSHCEGWPTTELSRPLKRQPYTLPFDNYPVSFQDDVRLFERRMTCDDPDEIFADEIFADPTGQATGRRRSARPRTVKTRLFQIRMAAAGLVHGGHAPATIKALFNLVQPSENAKTILKFYWEKANQKKGSQIGGVAEVLRQIVKYHCRLPDEDVLRISAWARQVTPPRRLTMNSKNKSRLRPLMVPRNYAMLLHLPQHLMRRACRATTKPAEAVRLALRAVALEILLICPLRLTNLTELGLGIQLQRHDPRSKLYTHFHFEPSETKGDKPIDWPIPRESGELIRIYLTRFRHLIAHPENVYLFPGIGLDPRSLNAMSDAITVPIAREIGATVHPHLLRHFAAWRYLRNHPGDYELVRQILGHSDVATTKAYYCGLEAEFAAEHFDRTVLDDRRATKTVAAVEFRKVKRWRARRQLS